MSTSPIPNAYEVEDNVLGSRIVTLQFTAGTSGAAPSSMDVGKSYVLSVTKSSNDYLFALKQNYQKLYPVGPAHVRQASFSAGGAGIGIMTASAPLAGTFTLSFYKLSDGTAVALATGDIVTLTVKLSQVKL